MLYKIEIIFAGLASLISFYIFLINIIKRLSFTLNRIFSILAFLSSLMFAFLMLQHLNLDIFPVVQVSRINVALVLLVSIIFYNLMFIYPENKLSKNFFTIFITSLPGYAVVFLTIFTDFIIKDVSFDGHFIYDGGRFVYLFVGLVSFYLIGTVVNILVKVKSLGNRALRREMLYILFSLGAHSIFILFVVILFPIVNNIYIFRNIGISISGVYILTILHYAVYDIKVLDLKKYFLKIFYWHIIFIILLIPIALAVYLNMRYFNLQLPTIVLSLSFFIYVFFAYMLVKPAVVSLFETEYRNLEKNFDLLFDSISTLNFEDKNTNFWELFYNRTLDDFSERFKISGIHLYVYRKKSDSYQYEYSVGSDFKIADFKLDDVVVKMLKTATSVVDRSSLYYDSIYSEYRKSCLEFFTKNKIEISIPLYNIDNELMGMIFLENLKGNKLYSKTFLTVLETYKLQFQYLLRNGLVLDEVKKQQIVKHDKILVNSIKEKIIPESVKQVKNLRASSMYVNKSEFGGDIISSIQIDKNKVAYFMADSGYSGIQSSFSLLELFGAFNSQTKKADSSDKILNNLNWVLCTSKYSEKYVSAFCVVYSDNGELNYSCASYNPMIIFDSSAQEFRNYELKTIPLGLEKDYVYESKTVSFTSDSIAVIFSPGLISAMNELGDLYSIDRIKDIIYNNYEDTPAILSRKIYSDFSEFVSEEKLINDASLIILKG